MFLVVRCDGSYEDKSETPIVIAKDLDEARDFAKRWIKKRQVDKYDDILATLEATFVPTVQAWGTEDHHEASDSLAHIVKGRWTLYKRA